VPLPPDALRYPRRSSRKLESSLGVDLGGVRVHTGEASADAAEGVSARAIATAQDIHFGAGEYDRRPPKASDCSLTRSRIRCSRALASRVRRGFKLEVSSPADAAEIEADQAADRW
jgi:uncharacterized protein DUF4157